MVGVVVVGKISDVIGVFELLVPISDRLLGSTMDEDDDVQIALLQHDDIDDMMQRIRMISMTGIIIQQRLGRVIKIFYGWVNIIRTSGNPHFDFNSFFLV